ncbi:hypothetical protein Xmau_01294 [Xenorhabdus mauleonii]|uniref:GIY-YIG domain-containing protein n=1 Tax=Xenorhabdus mauleonii TaxID=351675 RepID=A0A1I3KLH3_9GAMM|nr:hypothetical protein [Xenorhabdus mauleonii]PHM45089.1 hypothetical protein Xmau_01294 [Xenorhabdus mauleonii]SFI73353.1 hypothetical protein SAMN05421680_103123 [Xenorhabdus mauleonii]
MHSDYAALCYGKWYSWENRHAQENISMPGIYAIMITHDDYSGRNFNWQDDITYIGMTVAKSGLKGRLQQLENSLVGKSGHSGGNRIREKFISEGYGLYDTANHQWSDGKKLFVCIQAITLNPMDSLPERLKKKGFVANLEYLAFAKYVETNPSHEMPSGNKAHSI